MKLLLGIFALFLAACGDEPVETIENEPELGVIAQATEFARAPDHLYTAINAPSPWVGYQLVGWVRATSETASQVSYYPWGDSGPGISTGIIQVTYPADESCVMSGTTGFRCTSPRGVRTLTCPWGVYPNVRWSYRVTPTSTWRTWGLAYPIIYSWPGNPMSGGGTGIDTTKRAVRCAYQWSPWVQGSHLTVSNP